jgi:hypothetical protein
MKTMQHLLPSNISPIMIDGSEITFFKDDHGHPIVVCTKHHHRSIHSGIETLVEELPRLYDEKKASSLALLTNFLLKGEEFKIILDPEKYKQEYRRQLREEEESFDLPSNSLLSYGIFDIEELRPPKIVKGTGKEHDLLVFYVDKKIPYKVTCKLPLHVDPYAKYEILKHL